MTPATVAPSTGVRDDFDDEVAAVRNLVEQFWAESFSARGMQFEPIRGFGSYDSSSPILCGSSLLPPDNASYCSDGDFVAFDHEWLRRMYESDGDGAVYVVIPHEFGHAVQARLGTGSVISIRMELQADCFAGAFVADAIRTGKVQEEAGDAGEMFANLAANADPSDAWWLPDAHGTAAERQYAFHAGVLGGISAC
jgi:predicted metalloprotease